MANDTHIKPALTDREWEDHQRGNETWRMPVDMIGGASAWLDDDDRFAVIALQNDAIFSADPRKITREMVGDIEDAANRLDDFAQERGLPSPGLAGALRKHANVLAALLPPE